MKSKQNSQSPGPRISDAEWKVMNVFWEIGSASFREVVARLDGTDSDWKPRTVQTLIRRLTEKGALRAESKGRDFRYVPIVSQANCQHEESRTFLGRVFGGRLVPFMAGFMEREDLSREEIEEMRRLLDDAAAESEEPKPEKS